MEWIVAESVSQETWRRLLEYANIELTLDQIILRHGEPKSKSETSNYRKQATQIRVSILQAKEYFDAANSASTFTSANHIYYGIISLSTAMMLVLGDGKFALDALRKDNKNMNHGLDFTVGCNLEASKTGLNLLEDTRVEILNYGHFRNWYLCLPENENVYGYYLKRIEGGSIKDRRIVGSIKKKKYDDIVSIKKSLIDYLKYFPDLHADLKRFGLKVSSSRTDHYVTDINDENISHQWLIHGCSSIDQREELLKRFSLGNNGISSFKCTLDKDIPAGKVEITLKKLDQSLTWPDCRETMSHDTISYANSFDTIEIVDNYLVAYQLSMLSRYYPDLWVSCLESQCRAAKLIEKALGILHKKFPMLALSTMTPQGLVISNHREPWK